MNSDAIVRRRCFAEVMGTFMLVFTGCGAVIVNDLYGGALGHLGINIVFGLVVMAVVYSLGNVSGAHINPAVTIGFYAAKRFPANLLLPYIASQFAGAILAGLTLRALFPRIRTSEERRSRCRSVTGLQSRCC